MKVNLRPAQQAVTLAVSRALRETLRSIAAEGKAKLAEPVSDWVRRPTFRHYTRLTEDRAIITFTVREATELPLWSMVNYGTTEHSIFPRGPWPLKLRFRPAKTIPNSFRSRKRRPVVRVLYRMYVRSQAIRPRRWDVALVRFLANRAKQLGQKELARALKLPGAVRVNVKSWR